MPEKHLLVFQQGALGDMVLTFPALRKIRKHCGRITGVCQGQLGKPAVHLNIFDRYFPLESARFASLWSDSPCPDEHLRNFFAPYDEILLFSFSPLLEDRVRNISGKNVIRIPSRPEAGENIHVSQFIHRELAAQGVVLEKSRSVASENTHHSDSKKVLLHPGSGSPRKNWPIANYIRLSAQLESEGMEAEFILGPAETHLAGPAERGKVKYALISEVMEIMPVIKTAKAWIGNDSGLTHLAAFLGLPTVALFGPSDPDRWKPVGNVRVVRSQNLHCRPCFEKEKKNCDAEECLKGITVEDVRNELNHIIFS